MYGDLNIYTVVTVVTTCGNARNKRVTLHKVIGVSESEALHIANQFKRDNKHLNNDAVRYIWIPEHVDLEHAMEQEMIAQYAIAK